MREGEQRGTGDRFGIGYLDSSLNRVRSRGRIEIRTSEADCVAGRLHMKPLLGSDSTMQGCGRVSQYWPRWEARVFHLELEACDQFRDLVGARVVIKARGLFRA